MILYKWLFSDLQGRGEVFGLAAAMTFALCSALRLARFTAAPKSQSNHFIGMPTPAAAGECAAGNSGCDRADGEPSAGPRAACRAACADAAGTSVKPAQVSRRSGISTPGRALVPFPGVMPPAGPGGAFSRFAGVRYPRAAGVARCALASAHVHPEQAKRPRRLGRREGDEERCQAEGRKQRPEQCDGFPAPTGRLPEPDRAVTQRLDPRDLLTKHRGRCRREPISI